MQKSCKHCGVGFSITEEDLIFYDKVSPSFANTKCPIPTPNLCPACREQRRMSFRNDRFYYPRSCDLCKKSMLSLFHPSHPGKVYCNVCWWSDQWDPLSFGRDFDFNRPFFEQFKELCDAVPRITMVNDNGVQSQNCEYTTDFALGKNAYMVLCSWYVEDSMYGYQTNWVKSSMDNLYLLRSELMFETVTCENCYHCSHAQQLKDCSECIFGYDLINCQNCLLSAGLRNKQYCIWNQQYSKEEYYKHLESFNLGSWASVQNLKKQFAEFILGVPRKYANLIQCEDCTGDNLKRCKDSKECYNQSDLHGCKFMTSGDKAVDCYDCNSTGNPELCYDSLTPDNGYMNAFTADCWNAKFLLYCSHSHNSQNLFGCSGLKRNQYCILNKQYTKEEYEALMPRIIEHLKGTGEWGEFFPASLSPFAYDETPALEWHPLSQEGAEKLGYRWRGEDSGSRGKETVQWTEVPDHIKDAPETLPKEILACQECAKNYRLTKEEFEYYRKHTLPIPRFCPNCRHKHRWQKLNPRKLWPRLCLRCQNPVQSTYAPDRPERVYCEDCYLREVY